MGIGAQLLLQMRSTFYLAGATVAHHSEVADKLMIVVSGRLNGGQTVVKRWSHTHTYILALLFQRKNKGRLPASVKWWSNGGQMVIRW